MTLAHFIFCLLLTWDIVCITIGANVFFTLEKYEEAITDCQRAIELDP